MTNRFAEFSTAPKANRFAEFKVNTDPAQDAPDQRESRGIVGVTKDLGASFAGGSNALLELGGSLYGLATGDMENFAREQGARGREYWNERKTPQLKQMEEERKAKIDAADGEWAKLGTAAWSTLSSPSLLASYTFEQIPNLLVTGGSGKLIGEGVKAIAKKTSQEVSEKLAERAAVAGAVGTGAAMQGSDVGGQAYEQLLALPDDIWLANPDLQARINGNMDLFPSAKREIATELAQNSAIASGIVSIGVNSIPLFRIMEQRLVGAKSGPGSMLGGAAKGFAGESVGEAIEEGSGVAISNVATAQVDPMQPLTEGVGEAAGMGLAAGPLGAVAGASGRQSRAGEADIARTIFEAPEPADGLQDTGFTAQKPEDELDSAISNADRAASDTLSRGGDALDAEIARAGTEEIELPQAVLNARATARRLYSDPVTSPESSLTVPGQMPDFLDTQSPASDQTIPGQWSQPSATSTLTPSENTPIDSMILAARKTGDETSAARLEAAKRMQALSERFASEGNDQRAANMAERAQVIIEDVKGKLPVEETQAPELPAQSGERISVWTGRRGDGYETQEAAEAGLVTRQKMRADLEWRIEQMPTGKFQLAGYAAQRQARDRLTQPDMQAVDTLQQARTDGETRRAGQPDPAVRQMQGAAIDRAMRSIESRGGVATQAEADLLAEYGMGEPYDRIMQAPQSAQETRSTRPATDVLASLDRLAEPTGVRVVKMSSGEAFPSEDYARKSLPFRSNPGARIIPSDDGGVLIEIPERADQGAEWRKFAPETGTLNVPRETMPQIKAEHRGAMVNFLKGRFISSEKESVAANTLKPTQTEFSPAKVKQALEYEGGNRSILVSSDNYVVDGHHQWLANLDGDIQVIRIDAPIQEILEVIQEFPSATTGEAVPAGNYSAQLVSFAKKANSLKEVRDYAVKQFGPRSLKALDQAITGAWNIRNQEQRKRIKESDTISVAVAKLGGIKPEWQQDITGDTTMNKMVPGVGRVFTQTGTSPDQMALMLLENGYITQAQYDDMDGRDALYNGLNDDLSGRRKVYRIDSLKAQEEQLQALDEQYADEIAQLENQREQKYRDIEQDHGAETAELARLWDISADQAVDRLIEDAAIYEEQIQEIENVRQSSAEADLNPEDRAASDERVRQTPEEENRQPAEAGRGQAQAGASPGIEQSSAPDQEVSRPIQPSPQTASVEEAVRYRIGIAQREIQRDIDTGALPDTISSFSQLHDFVDGNEYVNDADRSDRVFGPAGVRAGLGQQGFIDQTNRMIDALDSWLAGGRKGMAVEYLDSARTTPAPAAASSEAVVVSGDSNSDPKAQFPRTMGFVEWALERAEPATETVEFDGQKYTKESRIFRGNIGGRGLSIREEIGAQSKFLINDSDHTLEIRIDGNYTRERGKVAVIDVRYTPVAVSDAEKIGDKIWVSGDEVEIISKPYMLHGGEFVDARKEDGTLVTVATRAQKDKDSARNQKEWTDQQEQFARLKKTDQRDDGGREAAAQVTNLDDFGEKLGGARKDQARMASMDKDMTADEIAGKTLSEIWPKSEVDAIEDKNTAAFVYSLRSEIPSKPRKSYALGRWAAEVQMLRNLVRHYSRDPERVERGLREGSDALKSFADKIDLLRLIDRDQWGRIGKVGMYPNAFRNFDGNKVPSPFIYVSIDGITRDIPASTVADGVDKVNEYLGAEPRSKSDKYEIRGYKNKNEWFIIKKGDGEYRKLKSFTGETALADAKKFKAESQVELDAAWEAVKERDNISKTDVRNEENRPRTGKDYRKGKDVTPDQFTKEFGFRGVEFGNWVTQGKNTKERQGMLNQAFDALMDLAQIVGIPPKAISLNGSMGLAFGSRGSGSASAHFEPGNLVINLTKTRGAGTLAHEWFHALDNYFQRARGTPRPNRESSYITYKPEPMYVHKSARMTPLTKAKLDEYHKKHPTAGIYNPDNWMLDPNHPEGVRPQVERSFAQLVEALEASPMKKRASAIDKGKVDGYWSRIIERAARSFENYIITKMHDNGYDNDYLANVKGWEGWGEKNPERYPYLKPDEIAPVKQAFDELFETIETRETDAGVALFSAEKSLIAKGNRPGTTAAAVTRSIAKSVEKLQAELDVTVVQSIDELPRNLRAQIPANTRIKGAYWNNSVYMVADNIESMRDAQVVLAHELVGHKGVLEMLEPQQWDDLKSKIDRFLGMENRTVRSIAEEVDRRYGNTRDDSWHAEFMAIAAERREKDGPIASLMRTLREYILRALKAFGLNGPFSVSELGIMLSDAERYLRNRGQQSEDMAPSPAFSAASESQLSRRTEDFVDGVLDGSVSASNVIDIDGTPAVYQALGASNLPLRLPGAVVKKAVDGKHSLTKQMLKDALSQIHDPVMVFDSATETGALVALTNVFDSEGRPVVAAIHLEKRSGRYEVNNLASIHGRNSAFQIKDWIEKDLLAYRHRQKSRSWLQSVTLQLRWEGVKNGSRGRILLDRDVVNREGVRFGQDGFDLDQYTEQDIADQQRAQTDREKAEALRKQRQQADDQVDDFTLTGSNSEADQAAARGQGSLFSRASTIDWDVSQQAESEFAAENRRLREEDKTLWSKAKTLLRKNFAPGGLLPDSVFRDKIARDGKMNVVEMTAQGLVKELESAIRKEYGVQLRNLNTTDMKRLSDALAGKMPANMQEQTAVAIVAMRQYVDQLSGQYAQILQEQIDQMAAPLDQAERVLLDGFMRAGDAESKGDTPAQKAATTRERTKIMDEAREQATQIWGDGKKMQAALGKVAVIAERASLMQTILRNQGQYVHRSYQVFDDPLWYKKISPEVYDNAMSYLIDRYQEDGSMTRAEAQLKAEKVIDEIVKTDTAYSDIESFIKESKLGAKDLSTLKRRKDIAPEIRALMGEYIDPRINFAKTATKMGRLIFNQRFLEQVKKNGMGVFLFDKDSAPVGTEEIAADGSEVFSPLNGLYTYREVKQAFQDALGKEQMATWYKVIVQLNGMVKGGKTILSPTTSARNFQSAMFFAIANGHFDLTQAKKSMALINTLSDKQKTEYLKKLLDLGVVYDNPNAQEMMDLLRESGADRFFDESTALGKAIGSTAEGARKTWEIAREIYSFGDDFWKVIGFENEKASLLKHTDMTVEQAEQESARRVRDLYPTYSMVGSAVQWLRRFPLVGTFVSFPAEIIRTTFNMFRTVHSDWQTPGMRPIAIQRAIGMSFVAGFAYAAQEIAKAMFDIDDEDEEAIRLQGAPWQQNSNLVITGRDEQGNLQYVDISFLDPYNYFKRPITAILRDQPFEDALISGASDMLSPFFGTDIAAGALLEIYSNKTETGGRVFKESDSIDRKLMDIADHLRKAVQPGIASNLERTYMAMDGQTNASGKKYDMGDEGLAWVGWRVSTLDPKTALYYRSFEFSDQKSDASRALTEVLNDPNDVSSEDIERAYERAVKMRFDAYSQMSKIVGAAQRSGMSPAQIQMVLRSSSVSALDRRALISGTVPALQPTAQAETLAIRRAEALIGREKAMEIRGRYRLVRTIDQ